MVTMEIIKSVYIIPFMAVLYVLYANVYAPVIPGSFSVTAGSDPSIYTIDAGARDTGGDAVLQGPLERVSGPLTRDNITYRLIEKDLVYFSSPANQNFSRVKVELKFIDTIPDGYELRIGMKNQKEWSYLWNTLYNPFYASLEAFNLTGENSRFRIYSPGNNLTMPVDSFLASPPAGSTVASGAPVRLNALPDINHNGYSSSMNELRGAHTFYVYTKGNVGLSVTKQDLNWYNGSDSLDIRVYLRADTLLKNITIPDDGNPGNNNSKGYLQNGTIEAALEQGVYKITLTGGDDTLIRSIKLSNGSIIVQNPFLAGILYTNTTKFNLYTRAVGGDRLGFVTYHAEGLQTINITNGNYTRSLGITAVNEWLYIDLPADKGLYKIEIPKGDILIKSRGYFSFSNDSYFDPPSVKILTLQNSMEWLKTNKVDYIIIPVPGTAKDGNWTIASTEFNFSDAYIENNALSFAISAPHLSRYNYSIPVDWIKIHVEK